MDGPACRALPRPTTVALLLALIGTIGCLGKSRTTCPTPAESGIYVRDLIDPASQKEADELARLRDIEERAARIRAEAQRSAPPGRPPRNVLCLSGGGSLGAYTAGVLCGWTESGTRPEFDVVTGISTGALVAPLAFLGPKYDPEVKRFYTTLRNEDVYKTRYVRGLVGEALADNAPLGRQIDRTLTPEVIAGMGAAHAQGRRLYVGTTSEEGKRFVVWDVGAIACRNGPGDRDLIRQILLGSAAIPGFFTPAKIDVTVDGVCYSEKHCDGGVSQGIFFRPPYVPPEQRQDPAAMNLAGTKVWAIVAGKLYADPEVIKSRALAFASKSVSTMIYAQARGDLQRMYLVSVLHGMDMYLTAVPAGYPAPADSADFNPEVMTKLFDEGRRQVCAGTAWRTTPPGVVEEEGEPIQTRAGRCLTHQQRGPILPIHGPRGQVIPPLYPRSDEGSPAVPPVRQ